MKHNLIHSLAGILALGGLFSCSTQMGEGPNRPADGSYKEAPRRSADSAIPWNASAPVAPAPAERPGLATGWGQEQNSPIYSQSFVRSAAKPAGVDAIYYNNPAGIKAMAQAPERVNGMQAAAGGLVEWGIKGRAGLLPAYKEWGYGRRLVAGSADSTYSIQVKNRSRSTLEVVASVDGLDVMDGTAATYAKRGYLIAPGEALAIDGFRTSHRSVAAFKFSSVADSYANLRHGDTRNVGVIGLAVFSQKGVSPWTWMPDEVNRRTTAQPFAVPPRSAGGRSVQF
ncbi:MAG: hypothetical protein NTW21_40970 [Verrucomicrobia bacterium]|nr:hypothetical protein [Verrucomicrobiota bacterium]